MVEFDQRYGGQWSAIAAAAKSLQGNHCACCGKAFSPNALQVHHVRYSDGQGMLGDRAIPGQDVFAVCGAKGLTGTCHDRLHKPDVWLVDPINPAMGNRNVPEIAEKLKRNFQSLTWKSNPSKIQPYAAPTLSEETQPSDRFSRRLQQLQSDWEKLELEPAPENDLKGAIVSNSPLALAGSLALLLMFLLL